jgi:Domain of unknown function (DUF4440)
LLIENRMRGLKIWRKDVVNGRSIALALMIGIANSAVAKPEPHTASAVIQADEAWGDAEAAGNSTFVNNLLLPEYRSVGNDGHTTLKSKILEGTRKRAESAATLAAYATEIAAWKIAHPSHAEVTLAGDTAVLRWMVDGSPTTITSSCDVFVYRNGRWRALYSQHTGAES